MRKLNKKGNRIRHGRFTASPRFFVNRARAYLAVITSRRLFNIEIRVTRSSPRIDLADLFDERIYIRAQINITSPKVSSEDQ